MNAVTDLLLLAIGLLCGGVVTWIAAERRNERFRTDAEIARRDLAAVRARLDATSGAQEQALTALLERAKNEVRDATAARASERVGDLVKPMHDQLAQFSKLIGTLESAATVLSSQTSALVSALRNPTDPWKMGRDAVEKRRGEGRHDRTLRL